MLQKMGIPITVATLSEPTRQLTEWRAKWRRRWGGSTVEIGADPFSSVQVIRALEEGHCMAMLADRPLPEHGIPVDLRMAASFSPPLPPFWPPSQDAAWYLSPSAARPEGFITRGPTRRRGAARLTRGTQGGDRTLHPVIAASLFSEVSRARTNGINSSPSAYEISPPSLFTGRHLHAQELTPSETTDLLTKLAAARQGVSIQTDFREEKHLALMENPSWKPAPSPSFPRINSAAR